MSNTRNTARRRWLSQGSAAVLAVALSVGAQSQAQAQAVAQRVDNTRSVQGNATVVSGSATITTGATRDEVTVNSAAVIINWTTLDTATVDATTDFVNFLPQGTEVEFRTLATDFTVLNRVIPANNGMNQFRGIALNGTVTGTVDANAGGVTGGSVWFYSPGGILVGSGAAFNVGSVVLTTSDIQAISGGPRIDFLGVADPMSAVTIQQGATITAPNEASSAIFFAPTIRQGGTVDVNGSVLYMSAAAGSVFDNGLNGLNFFTAFGGEAADGNGIFHTGTTTGPASQQVRNNLGVVTTPDAHVIDFFARGANLQILLEGSLGYRAANVASQDVNGVIRLGSGPDSAGPLTIGNLSLTSNATIEAQSINLALDQGETFQALGDAQGSYDVSLVSNDTRITVNPGGAINIAGNLTARRANADGGELTVNVIGDPTNAVADGRVTVGGNFEALFGVTEAQSSAAPLPVSPGAMSLSISGGGVVDIGGNLDLDSSFVVGTRAGNSSTFALEGNGGQVNLTMTGADSQLLVGGTLDADASVQSNTSAIDFGASATGGTVTIDIQAGLVDIDTLDADASARASGGDFDAGSLQPLDGTGGTVTVALGNAVADIGAIALDASGFGANAAEGVVGGAGIGGTARLTKGAGGSLAANVISVVANGDGGGGASGGAGQPGTAGGQGTGGTAEIILGQHLAAITQMAIRADGTGGIGGTGVAGQNGGLGGRGVGGTATVQIISDQAVFENLVDTSFSASGAGGGGGFGGSAAAGLAAGDGGVGGEGLGGTATLDIGGTGALFGFEGPLFPDTSGQGGDGGSGGSDNLGGQAGTGGMGGNGTTGTSRMIARDGAEIAFVNISSPVSLNAFGGRGGFGGSIGLGTGGMAGTGGNGGDGIGGTFEVTAIGGTFSGTTVPLVSRGSAGDGGNGGGNGVMFINAGPMGSAGNGTGGDLVLSTQGAGAAVIDFGDLTLSSIGVSATGTTGSGSISIINGSSNPDSRISLGSLTVSAMQGVTSGQTSFRIASSSGAINVTGGVDVDVIGNAVFDFTGGGRLVAGAPASVDAGGDIRVNHANNTGSVSSIETSGTLSFNAGGDVIATSIIAGEDAVLQAGRNLQIDSVVAQGDATIRGPAGVDIGSLLTAQGGSGFAGVQSDGNISIGSLAATDSEIASTGGSVRIEDEVDISGNLVVEGTEIFLRSTDGFRVSASASDGGIDIRTQGNLNIRGADATGNIRIQTDGGLIASEVFAFDSTTAPNAGQSTQQTTSSGGGVTLIGGTSLTIDSAVTSAAGVRLETPGILLVDASVVGQNITVLAGDVQITADGSLGIATRTFAIDFLTQGDAVFGGAAIDDGQFRLDNDELTRVSSGGRLSLSAQGVSPGDNPVLTVEDVDVVAGANSGNFGQSSALELFSDRDIFFNGALNVTGATADTQVLVDALNLVTIALGTGGIFVADANSGLAGEVIINATDFEALSDGVSSQIAGATVAEISDILADNRGINRPDGVITADTLTIATRASNVFIQNTAPGTAFDDRRGFTVNTLNISTGGSSAQPIVINGIVNGQTGIAAIAPTNIGSTVAPGSTINGCAILNPASCTGTTPDPIDPIREDDIPVRDIIEEEVRDRDDEGENGSGTLDRPLIDLEALEDPAGEPLIDDPVTGAGNEDLWEPAE